ncbi:MAG: hypothetical protein B7C24_01135 [Bacteroidetes bacterium 4572_77]|nr:MAG: hypothetical protein B7C24_01135 [Bacteroidetes bacterium 4572_77]
MNKHIIIFSLLLISKILFAQGELLIIGGGSESDASGAWSTEPYTWAVDQSENKRVAVIYYGNSSDWIPDYFKNECGASFAKNFKIGNNSVADSQTTYDSLMTYDVIFFKGGDQWSYYNIYKNTKTSAAIQDKYNDGGVICGTSAGLAILSEVVFTAKKGSVYPDECIENPNNQYVTLKDDFLNLYNNYIFDSHFMDRGRSGRLIGFLANWNLNYQKIISGIGVDETTALAISSNNMATVYGTGAVNIYTALSNNPYSLNGTALMVDSLRITQLLHHNTINLTTGEISGLDDFISPIVKSEKGNYTVFASGSNNMNSNLDMLNDLAQELNISLPITIITGSDQTLAQDYKSQLINIGASSVTIYSAISSMSDDPDLEFAIKNSEKFLFVDNEYYILEHFIDIGGNGALLYDKIRHNNMVVAFVGDNSRYAGATVVENYLIENAANNATLVFKKGLGLLQTTVIMPNTYYNTDMYMNSTAAVPYCMINDSLRFGIWLTKNNYLKYKPENDIPTLTSYGKAPLMLLENNGTNAGFATKTYSDNYSIPRMIAGFNNMKIRLISSPITVQLGDMVSPYGISDKPNKSQGFNVYPNPANNFLYTAGLNGKIKIVIRDINGRKVYYSESHKTESKINIQNLPKGIYTISATNENSKVEANQKFVVSK